MWDTYPTLLSSACVRQCKWVAKIALHSGSTYPTHVTFRYTFLFYKAYFYCTRIWCVAVYLAKMNSRWTCMKVKKPQILSIVKPPTKCETTNKKPRIKKTKSTVSLDQLPNYPSIASSFQKPSLPRSFWNLIHYMFFSTGLFANKPSGGTAPPGEVLREFWIGCEAKILEP